MNSKVFRAEGRRKGRLALRRSRQGLSIAAMKRLLFLPIILAGCGPFAALQTEPVPEAEVAAAEGSAPPPPENARSVEDFDTTTAAQRIAAAAPASGGRLLGTTVASLGDPSRPGFWIETPLASTAGTGRLVYPVNGKAVEVELLPLDSGSSRVSLAAFRLLEAPLTDLPVLEVYAN